MSENNEIDDVGSRLSGPWAEYRRLVLSKLTDNDRRLASIETILGNTQMNVRALEVKAGIVGAAVSLVVALAFKFLVR